MHFPIHFIGHITVISLVSTALCSIVSAPLKPSEIQSHIVYRMSITTLVRRSYPVERRTFILTLDTPTPQTITIDTPPQCTQTITPDSNGYVPPGTCNALYDYYPSFAAALIFTMLFFIITVYHFVLAFRYKTKYAWVICMAGTWEFLAFAFRTISTKKQQSTGILLVGQLFVLLAPLWINAFDYQVLSRMIHYYIPHHKIFSLKASLLSSIFVTLDFASFVVQIVGGLGAAPTSSEAQILKSTHIYMGGICLQEFWIVVFIGFAVSFHSECLKLELNGLLRINGKENWRGLLYTLYSSLGLITIRIIYRFVEFSQGIASTSPILNHEIYFYIFEATPMLIALTLMAITHPGAVMSGPDSDLPPSRWTIKRRAKKQARLEQRKRDRTVERVGSFAENEQYALQERGKLGGDRVEDDGQSSPRFVFARELSSENLIGDRIRK